MLSISGTGKFVHMRGGIAGRAFREAVGCRAQAVQEFLIGRGVKPHIETEAKGPHAPIVSNKTEEGRAQNRRTEIEFAGLQSVAQK